MAADVYGRPGMWYPLRLDRGVHVLQAHVRGKGPKKFHCSLSHAEEPSKVSFAIQATKMVPDLLDGYLWASHFAVAVTNLHPTAWLKGLKVSVAGRLFPIKQTTFDILPGQVSAVTGPLFC